MSGCWPPPTSRWSARCEEGLFREDLFYRLNVITIHIPPLRERREEIPVFLDYFLRKYSEFYGKQPAPFSDYAVEPHDGVHLAGQHSRAGEPGQALRHRRQRSADYPRALDPQAHRQFHDRHQSGLGIEGRRIRRRIDLPAEAAAIPINAAKGKCAPRATRLSLLEIGRRAAMSAEREAIERVLTQTRWNRRQAAKILKISYKALLNKLKVIEEQNAAQNKNLTA